MEYKVSVIIEPKPYLSDPEGDTILKDLIIKRYDRVKKVRTAKMLTLIVDANSIKEAEEMVKQLCDELRIYNPVVSYCRVSVDAST